MCAFGSATQRCAGAELLEFRIADSILRGQYRDKLIAVPLQLADLTTARCDQIVEQAAARYDTLGPLAYVRGSGEMSLCALGGMTTAKTCLESIDSSSVWKSIGG